MIGWNKVTKPKNRGGLGLYAAKERNTTIAVKLCWRMKGESSELCAKVLKHKYKRRSISSRAPKSRSWKVVLHGATMCELGSKWTIGSNSQLSFQEEKWLDISTVRECIEGPLHQGKEDLRVCDIYSNGMWELHKLSFVLPPLLNQSIKATPIRTTSLSEDHLSWISSPRREFDSRSAYLIACGANTSELCFRGNWMWKLKTLPKIHIFLWKCYHNSIPVKVVLAHKGIQLAPTCDLCEGQLETISHVLRDCTAAKEFWVESNQPNAMQHTLDLEVMEWIKANACCTTLAQGKSYPQAHFFLFSIWYLWLQRNKRLFQTPQPYLNLCKPVEMQVYEYWFCILDHVRPRSGSTIAISWVKPPLNWVKLNTDGFAMGNPRLAGGGGLIRDCNKNQVSGFARAIGFTISIAAELWVV